MTLFYLSHFKLKISQSKYKDNNLSEKEKIKILEEVILMIPENIHLNSFMYEPILDMSDWHLQNLYKKVESLK